MRNWLSKKFKDHGPWNSTESQLDSALHNLFCEIRARGGSLSDVPEEVQTPMAAKHEQEEAIASMNNWGCF